MKKQSVDLPDEKARKKILESLLRDEVLDKSVDIGSIAHKTRLYSGSDLKNLCVSAALARVKETLIRDSLRAERTDSGLDAEDITSEVVLDRLKDLDDWTSYLGAADQMAKEQSVPVQTHRRKTRHAAVLKNANGDESDQETVMKVPIADGALKGSEASPGTSKRIRSVVPLTSAHFDIGFAEVPPSLTDEMQTLIELRKWDEMYGDGAARRKGKAARGWGFELIQEHSKSIHPHP